jgi:hypothetical protein
MNDLARFIKERPEEIRIAWETYITAPKRRDVENTVDKLKATLMEAAENGLLSYDVYLDPLTNDVVWKIKWA